jgi:3-hydroxy-3-methylglutaryl CoA synthase
MPLDLIVKGTPGERSVAGPDEDSVTMGVAAVLDCLKGVDRSQVDGLFFSSTTSPFAEKQMATLIAKVADLREDIITADFAGSLRAGTTALKLAADAVKADSARQILVVASDCRLGALDSEYERNGGDGAASILIGSEKVAANLESTTSVSNEIYDVWRRSNDTFLNSWESRFELTEGYMKSMRDAVVTLMKKTNLIAKDFAKVVFYCPDGRASKNLAKSLGFDPKTQLQSTFFGVLGNTGVAAPLVLLVAALEEAIPGDHILMASYGNGSDALGFKVNENIGEIIKNKNRLGVNIHLKLKRTIPDYITYLKWRGLIEDKDSRIPYSVTYASAPAIFRERDRIFSFHGSKCNRCGAIQYPPQRICSKCKTKDDFQQIALYDKKGKVFTSSRDPVTGELVGVVNFEGGGRIFCNLSDGDLANFGIGTSVEMSFRKLKPHPGDSIIRYFWKAVPLRAI